MPLKLSLKPNEKIVLNGAVVQNGDRRTTLLLQNKASVLREKDIMQLVQQVWFIGIFPSELIDRKHQMTGQDFKRSSEDLQERFAMMIEY